MKYINFKKFTSGYKFLAILTLVAFVYSCEDDSDPTRKGDPFNDQISTVNVTIATSQSVTAEDVNLPLTVELDQTFASDATITTLVYLDNGNFTTGTVKVLAGESSGTGVMEMPSDDGKVPVGLTAENAGTLKATAILLSELVPGTNFVVESNVVDLDILSNASSFTGNLGIVLDWINFSSLNIDLFILDSELNIVSRSTSGNRFENIEFENTDNPDGTYFIFLRPFNEIKAGGENCNLVFSNVDKSLELLSVIIPEGTRLRSVVRVASFKKSTDEVSGEVSYSEFTVL